MGISDRGQQLRCRDGHFEMAYFELGTRPDGFWMWVACEFDGHHGGHWLRPDTRDPERLEVTSVPYAWPSALDAYDARDRWEAQQA